MSSSNCCFLTCIQISQKAGQVVWYSHLFQNFPQFIVIHIVKSFGIVNKAEIDVFFGTLAFSMIQRMLELDLCINELMLLNYGVVEDSWASLGWQGDQASQS